MGSKIQLKAEEKIVFIGDSITDAFREEVCYRPMGFGYVHFAANYLFAEYGASFFIGTRVDFTAMA